MTTEPKMFFRYRRFSEQTMAALCSDTVYLASPTTFNDPLDCQPSIECDSDLGSLRRLLDMLIQRRVARETETALKAAHVIGPKAVAHSQKMAANSAKLALEDVAYHATNPDLGESKSERESRLLTWEIERELRQHYERGVCCFAATALSPLMWSHYAESHKGLCIGYTADRLPRPELKQAVYGGRRAIHTSTIMRAIADLDADARDCLDREMLLRKAKCWSYEKEWRLIGEQGVQRSPLRLKEVTFGLRCCDEVKHTVIRALAGRKPPIEFFEIGQQTGHFSLRRRRVDLDELAHSFPNTAFSAEEVFGTIADARV